MNALSLSANLCVTCLSSIQSVPAVLALEALIPTSVFQQQVLSLQGCLPSAIAMDFPNWTHWLDANLLPYQSAVQRKPGLAAFLANVPVYRPEHGWPVQLHFYTDGSAQQSASPGAILHAATWAFAVWADLPTGLCYVGHAAGSAVPPSHPLYVGEVYDDALTGEQLAIIWAEAWVYEASAHFRGPFHLHFDSQSAGSAASSHFGLVAGQLQERLPLSQATVLLRQLCDTRALLTFHHGKGHSGQLCNELVDVLAGQERACAGIFDPNGLPTWPADVLRHPLRQWAWLASLHSSPGLPTLFSLPAEAGRLYSAERERTFQASDLPAKPRSSCQSSAATCKLLVHCGSANVLTMQDGHRPPHFGEGMRVTGKKELLKQQLLQAKVHLFGLQETRLPEACVAPDGDFYILQSPCLPMGTHGCALWVNLSLPYGKSGNAQLCFRRERFTVTAFMARYLVVQCEAVSLLITIVVAHAPYSGATDCPVTFWQDIQRAVDRRPRASQVLVLTDANAHLGSEASSAVGTHQAEPQNAAGAAFHDFLLRNDLACPATFEAHECGPGHTWTSPTGHTHRLDYIVLPRTWLGSVGMARL